jgi:hypothetical protein
LQEIGDKKITTVRRSAESASGFLVSKKKSSLFGFLPSSVVDEIPGKNTAAAIKEFVLKGSRLNISRAHLTTVKSWAALEEKIVHDYKEQNTILSKSPAKQSLPTFETFTTQTAVPFPQGVSKSKAPLRGSKRTFLIVMGLFLICGWLAAGVFVFLHSQGVSSNRESSRKLEQLQNEKEELGRSYAALKSSSADHHAEMRWRDSEIRDMASELKAAHASAQGLEEKYRQELMQITVRYEAELAALRSTAETQNAIVIALKAQGQAFDKIVDQAGMSALSGAAAGLSKRASSAGENAMPRGEVTSVNGRQGSVVINMGAEQGARSGRWITISRDGIEIAAGRLDRVYNTMAVALVRDARMLQVIREGDIVSLS